MEEGQKATNQPPKQQQQLTCLIEICVKLVHYMRCPEHAIKLSKCFKYGEGTSIHLRLLLSICPFFRLK